MRRLSSVLALFIVSARALVAGPPAATSVRLIDGHDRVCSIEDLCRKGEGLALLVLKAFPSAHAEALRAVSQLPPGVAKATTLPVRVALENTRVAKARLYFRTERYAGEWLADPEGRLLDRYAIHALPCWLFFASDGSVTQRATFLRGKDLAALLDRLRKPLRRGKRR